MDADLHKRALGGLAPVSRTLAELVAREPPAVAMLEDPPSPETYRPALDDAFAAHGVDGLRATKRLLLLSIAATDAAGEATLEETTAALSTLADACIAAVLEAKGGAEDLAVVAMGKLGGRELNYYSDIDLMFVTTGDVQRATRVAAGLVRDLGDYSPRGRAYEIDTNLRPEGRDGALVRSLEGFLEYYRRWAKPWEYQALIKARHVAGDVAAGEGLIRETRALVFPAEVTTERIASIRAVKERVEEHASRSARRAASDRDDVKLGPGGIRDIEFSVQLLQLVHGGADPDVRGGNTLEALGALAAGGYMAEDDEVALRDAYTWLRNVEHRLQLWQERRVRHLPTDDEGLGRVGRVMGFTDSPRASAAEQFRTRHEAVLVDVRGRFDKLFYRPMIEALAGDGVATRLSPDALRQRLRVLGYRDVERAAKVLHDLVSGTSRRARLFRVLSPPMLRFLASAPQPDEGLFSFLLLGEGLESRVDLWGALRDNPPGLEFLARVLGSGRLLGEVLAHVPEELVVVAGQRDAIALKDRDRLGREAVASLGWRSPEERLDGLRRFKRREMLDIALVDLAGEADAGAIGSSLADLADACLGAALDDDAPLAIIGMGKLGGRELSYSSDVDVMFVARGDPLVAEKAAERLVKVIGEVTPEGQAFRIDAALRPEGKSGPLARSLESFREYYERWAKPWEFQALLKARLCAGDAELGARYLEMANERAFPARMDDAELAEIRHLKARMEHERIPRGTDPRRNFKLGPGGMSDIEFAVQILQRANGRAIPELRVTGTIPALEAAGSAGLVGEDDARLLGDAYAWLLRLRNRLFFMVARPVDALPPRPEDLEALGIAMGFTDQPRQELEEQFLRTTRRVRRVAEALIYG